MRQLLVLIVVDMPTLSVSRRQSARRVAESVYGAGRAIDCPVPEIHGKKCN
jgi:hypothetical protein